MIKRYDFRERRHRKLNTGPYWMNRRENSYMRIVHAKASQHILQQMECFTCVRIIVGEDNLCVWTQQADQAVFLQAGQPLPRTNRRPCNMGEALFEETRPDQGGKVCTGCSGPYHDDLRGAIRVGLTESVCKSNDVVVSQILTPESLVDFHPTSEEVFRQHTGPQSAELFHELHNAGRILIVCLQKQFTGRFQKACPSLLPYPEGMSA